MLQVPNGAATVNAASGAQNRFVYAALPGPGAVLAPNIRYYVLSYESVDDDQFYDNGNCSVTTTSDAVCTGNCYSVDNLNTIMASAQLNHPNGPLDLKYSVGGTPMLLGSPWSAINAGDQHMYQTGQGNYFLIGDVAVVSGTITLDGIWYYVPTTAAVPPPMSAVMQWIIDENTPNSRAPGYNVLKSPMIVGPRNSANTSGHNFPWQLDTTQLVNGTHSVRIRFFDANISGTPVRNGNPDSYASTSMALIVQNGTPRNDALPQPVPCTQNGQQDARILSPSSDWVVYPGSPQAQTVTPYPTVFVPPVYSPGSPYHRQTDPFFSGIPWSEDLTAHHWPEYDTFTCLATTPSGGVVMSHTFAQIAGNTIESQYFRHLLDANYSGGRCDNKVSSFTTWVTDPNGNGFYGVELFGALWHLSYTGSLTHVCGYERDRTKLPFEQGVGLSLTEDQLVSRLAFTGTMGTPSFQDCRGLNDLCFDPRDATHKTLYMACPRRHIIIKVDLNTDPPTMTRYAGQDGVSNGRSGWIFAQQPCGAEVDAPIVPPQTSNAVVNGRATEAVSGDVPLALFNEPYSICMADGANPNIPAGAMFVADFCNGAIRYITADGCYVGTLVGIAPINPSQANTDSTGDNAPYQFSPASTVNFTQAWVNFPQTVRLDSRGNPIFLEIYHQAVRVCNLTAPLTQLTPSGTLRRIGLTGWAAISRLNGTALGGSPGGTWGWMDIDVKGANGRVDDILVVKAMTNPNETASYRISRDGKRSGFWSSGGAGTAVEDGAIIGGYFGDAGFGGAYAWVVCFDQNQNRVLAGGYRHWGLQCLRANVPGDPAPDASDQVVLSYGHSLYWQGSLKIYPWGFRPSMASLHGPSGRCFLGTSIARNLDEIAAAFPVDTATGDYTAAAEPATDRSGRACLGHFIQQGMDGVVPRPEITGNDLRALCHYIRRNTVAGSYPKPIQPGPKNTDSHAPIITSFSAARVSPTSISVTFATSKPTIGIAIGCSDQVWTNAPNAQSSYCVTSPLEGTYSSGSRTLTLSDMPAPSPGHPSHVSVLVKDIAGNSVYYPDEVLT